MYFSPSVLLNSSSPLKWYPRPVSQYVIVVRVQARVNVTLACRCLITSGLARCFSVRCVEVVSIPLHKHDPSYTECKRIHLTTSYEILHLLVLLLAVRFIIASSNWTFELYSTISMFGCLLLQWILFKWVGNLCQAVSQPTHYHLGETTVKIKKIKYKIVGYVVVLVIDKLLY